jgi:hypothetical protein
MREIFITEEQHKYLLVKNSLEEMAYPVNFNMEELKNINSFVERVKYCNSRLKYLGQGSSRRVYMVDDEKCLKMAKNRKGIAQNIEEINLGNDIYAGSCFAKVYDYDQNGLFVEMELARKAKESDFERLAGIPFDCYCDLIVRTAINYLPNNCQSRNWVTSSMEDTYNYVMDNIDNFEFINQVIEYMYNFQVKAYGDLQRISSYGVVKRNGQEELVIVDFGLTEDVFNNYYRRK